MPLEIITESYQDEVMPLEVKPMQSGTITERELRLAMRVKDSTLVSPQARVDFEKTAQRILSGDKNYEPSGIFLTAVFRGLDELGIVDDNAVDLVKKGLESLGVAVLSS